ncbi:MAG TPA: hypothetical protein VEK73_16160 [Xanthobacteraceae bacterium]|nr:hypothetical protein [Xanthobacteraceae bacterium]
MDTAWMILEWVVVIFLALIGILIIYQMLIGKINLDALINESDGSGKASLSRFQLLLFTFTIVGIFVVLSFKNSDFATIPNGVLGLLGISGGSYVLSKGIQMQGNGNGNGASKAKDGSKPT